MQLLLKALSFCLFFLTVSFLYSRDEEFDDAGWNWESGGYYKNIFAYHEKDKFHEDFLLPPEKKKMISDLNRISLSPEIYYEESFIFHADIDFEAVSSNYNNTDEFDLYWKESLYNDLLDLTWEPVDNSRTYASVEFRNIYAKMVSGKITGTAGRQQIRFGSSRLWNPLDLMNPISPTGIEGADEQKGVDAVRLDWYPIESAEITGVVSPKKEGDSYEQISSRSGNFIVRMETGVKECDAGILGGYTAKRTNFGIDFAAVINDGLLNGVALYSVPEGGKEYFQCGLGYEYTFVSGMYFLMEYFYNSLPVNEDEELQAALFYMAAEGVDENNYYILSNRIITFNSHYLSCAAGYDFFPLLRGEIFSIYDFQGRGLFLNGFIKLNAMENMDLTVGIITATVDETDKVSDFSSYDKQPQFYLMLQFYF
jgi:hypothetical protein